MIRYSPEHVAWLRAEPPKAEAESEAALVLAADDYGYDCDWDDAETRTRLARGPAG
jgi:hypothetical protein